MTQQFSLLLFAAGRGTRMGALGDDKPKCLIEVAGKALLDHALDLTNTPVVSRRVVNLHYKSDMIKDHCAGKDLHFSQEYDQALETGGGLRHALPLLMGDPVITLNCDAVWTDTRPIDVLAQAWQPHMDGLMLLATKKRAIGHLGAGDFNMDKTGKLARGKDYIYTGLQIVRTDLLMDVTERVFSLNVLWDQFLAKGTLHGVIYDGSWCDVGQPESIALAEAMLGHKSDV